MRRRVLAVAGGLAMAGILAACGASNDAAQPSGTVPPGSVPTSSVPPTTQPIQYDCTPADAPLTIEAGKLTVEIPAGDPPTELVTEDITVGDGPTAAPGDKVSMQYVGVLYSDGTEFDASWNRGEPFEVVLGEGNVIQGWDQGIPGMNLGGRRQLVIPPDLAYGDRASEKIPAGSTLVFVVDLAQVCKALPASTGTTVDATGTTLPGATATTVEGETTTTVAAGETTTTVATESTTTTSESTTTTTVTG